jgi:ATP-dependent DNA helicase Rep
MHNLNPQQLAAIEYISGPCLVIAGAGSGKTRVIIHKIAHLIEQGFNAKNIAAITFTNKAASEMKHRIISLSTSNANGNYDKKAFKQLTICTFHALGLKILRQESEHIGFKPNFSIFSSDDVYNVLQNILSTTDKNFIKGIASAISNFKNKYINTNLDIASFEINTDIEEQAAKVYELYVQTLKAYQAVDFDDLIQLPYQLLKNNHNVQLKWQSKLRYVLVDEYQDTNICQYELLRLIVGDGSHKVPLFTAVGDDDQAIYGWRGASSDNIDKLNADFNTLKVIKLEQNYRSSNNILQAANNLIANNDSLFNKKLWSEHGIGDEVAVYTANDEEHEAESTIFRISAHKFERQGAWENYAVLYRSNYQSRLFEQILRRENIPYTLSGGQSFFEKAEIKDICAYLRLIYNSNDDPAFIRAITTPKKGIGTTTLAKLSELASKMKCSLFDACFLNTLEGLVNEQTLYSLRDFVSFINSLSDKAQAEGANILLDELIDYINYESYLYDNFDERMAKSKWTSTLEFINWLKSKGTNANASNEDDYSSEQDYASKDGLNANEPKNLLELTQMIALMTILEGKDKSNNGVQLSTLHAAKGLEYPHVFLIGIEEGILPFNNGEGKESNLEEERRLMYVGVTRAERSLHISWCKSRRKAGEKNNTTMSRFLNEMKVGIELEKKMTIQDGNDYLKMLKNMLK